MRRKQGGSLRILHNAGFGQCLFQWYRVSYECTRCQVLVARKRNSGNKNKHRHQGPFLTRPWHLITGGARSSLLYQNNATLECHVFRNICCHFANFSVISPWKAFHHGDQVRRCVLSSPTAVKVCENGETGGFAALPAAVLARVVLSCALGWRNFHHKKGWRKNGDKMVRSCGYDLISRELL